MEDILTVVTKAANGDSYAFGELYAEVYADLFRFAFFKLGNHEDAEDAVQEAAEKGFSAIKKLKDPMCFRKWMFTILLRCCKQKIPILIQRRNTYSTDDFNYNFDQILTCDKTDAFYRAVDEALELKCYFKMLSNDESTVVLLSAVGGYKSNEIAEMTMHTAGAVRSILSRALYKLRNGIDKLNEEEYYVS